MTNAVRIQFTLEGAPPIGQRGWQPGMTLDGRAAQFREMASRRDVVVKALALFGFRERFEPGVSDRWTIVAICETVDPGKPLTRALLETARNAGADMDTRIVKPIWIQKRQKSTLFSVHPVGDWIPRRDLQNKCLLRAEINLEPDL